MELSSPLVYLVPSHQLHLPPLPVFSFFCLRMGTERRADELSTQHLAATKQYQGPQCKRHISATWETFTHLRVLWATRDYASATRVWFNSKTRPMLKSSLRITLHSKQTANKIWFLHRLPRCRSTAQQYIQVVDEE